MKYTEKDRETLHYMLDKLLDSGEEKIILEDPEGDGDVRRYRLFARPEVWSITREEWKRQLAEFELREYDG